MWLMPKEYIKRKERICKGCIYLSGDNIQYATCNYSLIECHSRPCSPEDCRVKGVYKTKSDKKKTRKSIQIKRTTPDSERQRIKDWRKKKILQGLCPTCGAERPDPEKTYCENCLQKKRDYYRAQMKVKKENGICRKCSNPAVPGKTLCQKHMDKETERYQQKKLMQEAMKGIMKNE